MKQKLLFLFFLFSFSNQYAQEWQWIKRGGGQLEPIPVGYYDKEGVLDIDTDKNGNVYILSPLTQFNIDLDGLNLESDNSIAQGKSSLDFILASFDCDGNYRWSNVIGGTSDDSDFSFKLDHDGNSYLVGIFNSSPFNLAEGESYSTGPNDRFMIKYNSEGEVLWHKPIQENNEAYTNYPSHIVPKQLLIDKENNKLFAIYRILKGTYGGGQVVVEEAEDGLPYFYLFEYNLDGEFQNAVLLDLKMWGIAVSHRYSKFVRDPNTGNIYLAGYGAGYYNQSTGGTSETEVVFGDDYVEGSNYIGCFSPEGEVLWYHENEQGNSNNPNELIYDFIYHENYLYLLGVQKNSSSFLGHYFDGPVGNNTNFLFKLDLQANIVWDTYATGHHGLAGGLTKLAISNDEVGVAAHSYKLDINGETLIDYESLNDGTEIVILRYDKENGDFIGHNRIYGHLGSREKVFCMTADKKNNFYIGGRLHGTIYFDDGYIESNGEHDMLLIKYGHANCECDVPIATFSSSQNEELTHFFTYEGLEDYDTISWDFGDGNSSTENSPTHIFENAGAYEVCVTTSNDCGEDTFCQTVQATLETEEYFKSQAKIFPNPAKDLINIQTNLRLKSYSIYNYLGQKIIAKDYTENKIDIQNLPSGNYFLEILDQKNRSQKIFFRKE